jgi:hypothetical protein
MKPCSAGQPPRSSLFLFGRWCEVAVQGGLGDAGLGGNFAEAASLFTQQSSVVDLVVGPGGWPADVRPLASATARA